MARVTPRSLLRSSGVSGAVQIVRVVSSLLLTPIILAAIGLEGFGVWALLFSLSNSIHVMGVSFGNAYAKLTAEYDARGDYEGLSERIGSGLALSPRLRHSGCSSSWPAATRYCDGSRYPKSSCRLPQQLC